MLNSVVITGASGFLGQNVAKSLISRGYACTLLDINEPSDPALVSLVSTGRARFFQTDLSDMDSVARALGADQTDMYLIHLASRVESTRSYSGLREHFKVHLDPVFNLMSVLSGRLTGVCFASTIETYGLPQRLPIDESHPTVPFNLYGAGKLNTERLLRIECNSHNVPLCTLRLSHIYGPGETYRKAIPVFIESCLRKSPITLRGEGRELRDFVHVDDIGLAISLGMENRGNGTYNISGGQSASIREVLEMIQKLCGVSAEIRNEPVSTAGIDYRFDLRRAKDELGYEPQIPLAAGLTSEIQWFQERLV